MIYDVITYNGEAELFDLRYNILSPYVDEFIVVEFDKTFSGKPKEVLWDHRNDYDNVLHYFVEEKEYSKYEKLAKSSPNTEYGKGAEHWIREFCQKESIKDCLTHLKDDDIVFISDCDEIWNPDVLKLLPWKGEFKGDINKLYLLVYSYWLNNRSDEKFFGTIVGFYRDIKDRTLNHLRSNTAPDKVALTKAPEGEVLGWHFTSVSANLKKKLEDSYTKETYASDWVMSNLDKNIAENKDFLGRDFKYWISEEDWPQFLKDNREKYHHLLKPE